MDAPSSIPVELIELLMPTSETGGVAAMRMFRLFRLFRLLKLLHLQEFINRLEELTDVNVRLLRLFTLIGKMLYIAHLLGCGWFAMTWLSPDKSNWATNHGGVYDDDGPPSKAYMLSVYWAITTLTTVGYGDIVPSTPAELHYAIGALICSAIVFAYILGDIGAAIASMDRQGSLLEEKMDAIKEYLRWREVPKELSIRVRRFYEHYYSQRAVFDEMGILDGLSSKLNAELIHFLLEGTLGKLPLFRILPPDFQQRIFPVLRPASFGEGEVVYSKGDLSNEIFFLISGEIDVVHASISHVAMSRLTPENETVLDHDTQKPVLTLQFTGCFGQSVLLARRRENTLRVRKPCELFAISKEDLAMLMHADPISARIIIATVLRDFKLKDTLETVMRYLAIVTISKSDPARRQLRAALLMQMSYRRFRDQLNAESDALANLVTEMVKLEEVRRASEAFSDPKNLHSKAVARPKSPAEEKAFADALRDERASFKRKAGERRPSESWSTSPTAGVEASPTGQRRRRFSFTGLDQQRGSRAAKPDSVQLLGSDVDRAEWDSMRQEMRELKMMVKELVLRPRNASDTPSRTSTYIHYGEDWEGHSA